MKHCDRCFKPLEAEKIKYCSADCELGAYQDWVDEFADYPWKDKEDAKLQEL